MMKDELAKPEYTKLKLVDIVYGDDDDQKSFQETQGLLARLPEPQGHHLARPPSASPRPPATCPARRTRARSS